MRVQKKELLRFIREKGLTTFPEIEAFFRTKGFDYRGGTSIRLQDDTFGKGEEVMAEAELIDGARLSLTDAFSSGYDFGSNLFSTDAASELSAQADAYEDIAGISDSVKNIEKSVSMSEEDIAALVDVAERRYVNNVNLTAQTPIITVNGANTGHTAADRQNLANTIRDILIEQASSGSTRTTARAF